MKEQEVACPDPAVDEAEYIHWLSANYGDVAKCFPPGSVVCFSDDERVEYAVVGYCEVNGKNTVNIVDLALIANTPYDDLPKVCQVVCPVDGLPRLVYLYNKNGEEFAAKFRNFP